MQRFPAGFATLVAALASSASVQAQPVPSFTATCDQVRERVESLDRDEEELVTIEVLGQITHVRETSGLVYILVCEPPHPRILCVTYQTNGMKPGERVLLAGSLIPRDANHIQLDPCLARYPDE